uniref:Uncharacterized protein n=1 Tax=Meteorus pulchricornis TaxID=51522 RepID=H7CHK9_9HYME|nr:hypothetical protein [Meteorus pulchricornis]
MDFKTVVILSAFVIVSIGASANPPQEKAPESNLNSVDTAAVKTKRESALPEKDQEIQQENKELEHDDGIPLHLQAVHEIQKRAFKNFKLNRLSGRLRKAQNKLRSIVKKLRKAQDDVDRYTLLQTKAQATVDKYKRKINQSGSKSRSRSSGSNRGDDGYGSDSGSGGYGGGEPSAPYNQDY